MSEYGDKLDCACEEGLVYAIHEETNYVDGKLSINIEIFTHN